jgi:hypothetical protein
MEHHPVAPAGDPVSLNRLALSATAHCLAGCSIGEVLGMMTGAALRWSTAPTIVVSVVLAFLFGYAFTVVPLYRSGIPLAKTLRLALAADTVSIIIMEIVDNGIMLVIPGAMDAGLRQPLFWLSLAGSLVLAGMAAFPVNRWLISRGRGHAVVHALHASRGAASEHRHAPHQGRQD